MTYRERQTILDEQIGSRGRSAPCHAAGCAQKQEALAELTRGARPQSYGRGELLRDQEALAELTRGARPQSYGRGELLRDIEEIHGFVYILNAGSVGLYSLSRHGHEIMLYTFHDGDIVGLIRHGEVSDTCSYAKVLVDATLAYRLSYHHVLQLMSTSLTVTLYVCKLISRQLGESCRIIEELAFYEIKTRLARTLVRLALSSEELIVSATHAELAAMIGTRQEEVTKLLGYFRALGLVASAPHRRGLRVLDLERLASM